MSISTELVPLDYELDPETEVLFPDGVNLKNGMVVLDQHGDSVALENYRWCMVESFACVKGWVSFVGVYGDGLKMSRCVDSRSAWIVKKDSDIPETTKGDRKRAAVRDILTDALLAQFKHDSGLHMDGPPDPGEYVDKIMALFEEKS